MCVRLVEQEKAQQRVNGSFVQTARGVVPRESRYVRRLLMGASLRRRAPGRRVLRFRFVVLFVARWARRITVTMP